MFNNIITALNKVAGGKFVAQNGSKLICGLAPKGVEHLGVRVHEA